MKNYTVRRYHSDDFLLWNAFVGTAQNATFLFHRDFMEYHSDRFQDYSLLVFEGEKLISIVPANCVEDSVYSHNGLTYGGFVLNQTVGSDAFEMIYTAVIDFLKKEKKKLLVIKEMLPFYHQTETLDFGGFFIEKGAKITDKKMNLVIDFKSVYTISKSKKKHYRRLQSEGLVVKKEDNFDAFWDKVLTPLLAEKYHTKPLHTLSEITFLKHKFPQNIEQYNLYRDEEILAGITIFKTPKVVKSQYGATTENGKKHRALDYLFIHLIEGFSETFDYFDMGTVDDDSELGYNEGLLNQKKELGCGLYYQNIYQIAL
ncbi:GNAT family N-acetyltransferase [Flavobacterium sp. IMCC34852]|uniref:GNAT family N-acetyltransferase n=1 Tax=Flavobacterium rivulicola TaxID=2732161 RepID=A0A7Y3RA94_9FLAO|nr:GNAT family N-acetyltransferase [Flavobacterium sp. IMCC34852]NNT72792.1 GNAT family N-acetyltransferase [Flavobacterium sp. IMCC34852]